MDDSQAPHEVKQILIILNDPPYGTERSFNGLRLADELVKDPAARVTLFLMADAVFCAKAGQQTPTGFYNLERMLKPIARQGCILLCGSCMAARGLTDEELVEGGRRSTLSELARLTREADTVLVF